MPSGPFAAHDDAPSHGPKTDRERAVQALKEYNGNANDVRAWKNIPNFLGGTLILVSFNDAGKHYDHCVLVRQARCDVYQNWQDVMGLVPGYEASLLNRISAPQVVIMLLTLIIVVTSCAVFFTKGDVPEPFRAALSAVIGYWLGQSIPPKSTG